MVVLKREDAQSSYWTSISSSGSLWDNLRTIFLEFPGRVVISARRLAGGGVETAVWKLQLIKVYFILLFYQSNHLRTIFCPTLAPSCFAPSMPIQMTLEISSSKVILNCWLFHQDVRILVDYIFQFQLLSSFSKTDC